MTEVRGGGDLVKRVVSENPEIGATERSLARATGLISMAESTRRRVAENSLEKGDVLATARFAALQALTSPSSASPFRPEGPVESTIEFHFSERSIEVIVELVAPRGRSPQTAVLSAATVALLSIYDMCKAIDRSMVIGPVTLSDA